MLSPLLLSIVLPAIFGVLCGLIASRKNRSVYGWFFAGALLGPFGLIVAFLPKIRPAVIVVDLQGDFTVARHGALAVPGSDHAYLDMVYNATKDLKNAGCLILATQDWHPANHNSFASNHDDRQPFEVIELADGREQTLWPKHCVQDSRGAEILLESGLVEEVIHKGTDPQYDSYSGFRDDAGARTRLNGILQAAGVKSVIVFGIATDYCVKATALDAISLGYKVYVIQDLCRGVNEDSSVAAVELMARNGVVVLPNLDMETFNRL